MASEREELSSVAADLRAHLEWLRECGVQEVPGTTAASPAPAGRPAVAAAPQEAARPAGSLREAVRSKVAPAAGPSLRPLSRPAPEPRAAEPRSAEPVAPAPRSAPQRPPGEAGGARTMEEVFAELGNCQRCKLAGGRTRLVFGAGNPRAELVFVGEGPGAEEDQQGVPFVGAAGQLLTKMIEAMGYARADVYICNVVKCRPPHNRDPEPDEVAACEPFLKAQLASIKPKVIVALGKWAAQTLLRDSTPITRLRGAWREYQGVKLMPTFHPAYLLRSPSEKVKAWEDLKMVMRELGKQPPPPRK